MPLPIAQPLSMPEPAPIAMPPPAPLGGFGMSDEDQMLMAAVPGMQAVAGTPTPVGPTPTAPSVYGAQMNAVSLLTGGAITAANDPRTWSSEDAAAQTESALAKIAQVNPELARELAESQGIPTEDGEDKGFWGTLMGGLGKVLEVTHLDDVLELISRPAHILPEMIMDWGEESAWNNFADAMSGNSDVSWDDVLVEKLGWERNWLTAAVGFVGDVALDPLTYIPLGRLAATSRDIAALGAGKAVAAGEVKWAATEGAEMIARAQAGDVAGMSLEALERATFVTAATDTAFAQSAKTLEDAGAAIFAKTDVSREMLERSQKGLRAKLDRALNGVSPDQAASSINFAANSLAERGMMAVQDAASQATQLAMRGNFAKARAGLVSRLGWGEDYAEQQLKKWVAEGHALSPGMGRAAQVSKGKYVRAKVAAANLGGWRFHLNVPVLGLRIAPVRILPRAIQNMDFGMARRFFNGTAGSEKLRRMMDKSLATREHYEAFARGGLSGRTVNGTFIPGLYQVAPEVAKKLSRTRWMGNMGSRYMAASEAVGNVTARFSPGAALYREGSLTSIRALQLKRLAPTLRGTFTEEVRTITHSDGKTQLSGKQANELVAKVVAPLDEARLGEWHTHIDNWVRLIPQGANGADLKALMGSAPGTAALNAADFDALQAAQEFFRSLGKDGFEAAEVYRKQLVNAWQAPQAHGLPSDVDLPGYMDKDELNAADAAAAADASGQDYLQGTAWEAVDDDGWTQATVFTEDELRDVATRAGTLRGTHFKQAAGSISENPENTQRLLNKATKAQRAAQDELTELRAMGQGGGVAVVAPDIADTIAQAEARLAKANADIAKLTGRSRRFVVYGKNGIHVDLRGASEAAETAGQEAGGEVKRIEASVRAVAEQIGTAGKALDEAIGEAMAPELKAIADDLVKKGGNIPAAVTRTLQRQGVDHIRITNVDGTEELVVLRGAGANGTSPFARISDGAPAVGNSPGVHFRQATDEAYAAVGRSKLASELPGGSRVWLDRVLREASKMPLDEAEAFVHGKMREIGAGLEGASTVLEHNSIKALDSFVNRQVNRMTSKSLGQAVRDLDTMGMLPRVANGKLTTLDRFRYSVANQDQLDLIKELTPDVRAATERLSLYTQDKLRDLAAVAQEKAANLEANYTAFQEVIAGMGADTYRAVSGRLDPEGLAMLDQALTAARVRGASGLPDGARDIGDGMWMWTDEDGARWYVATKRPADEAVEGFDPIGTRNVGPDYDVYVHFTDEKGLKGILSSGRLNRSAGRGADAGTEGVYTYERKEALRLLAENKTLEGRKIAVEVRVPKGTTVKPGASNARAIDLEYIDAADITGITRAGDDKIVGLRKVDANGKVDAVADTTPGVRSKLVRQHWKDDGVFDAPDVTVAAAEAIRKQGVIGAAERRLAGAKKVEGAFERTDEGLELQNRLHREVREAEERFELEQAEMTDAIAEVERLQTRLTTNPARPQAMLVPADETALNQAGWDRLTHPGFEGFMMPSLMAKEFDQAVLGHKGIEGIHKEFRRFNAWWKSYATWVNPGFHLRNAYGAWFNNMLGGVNIADYLTAGRIRKAIREPDGKWAKRRLVDKGGDAALIDALRREGQFVLYGKNIDELTYGDLGRMTSGVGINTSNSQALSTSVLPGELGAGNIGSKTGKTLLDRGPVKPVGRAMRGAGTLTENVFRTAALVKGLKSYGTLQEARVFTMMRHGDYEDLTELEYGVIRDVLPFYKWMRTNTPFQIHQLLESPGKLLAVQKAQGAAYTAFGKDYDEEKYRMPSWMGKGFIIPYGEMDEKGVYDLVSFDLPMADLHKGARDYFSQTLPFIRPFIERFVIRQDVFTGAPLEGERVPLSEAFNLPVIRDLIKVTKLAEEGDDGRLYANKDNMRLLNIIPLVSRYNGWLTEDASRVAARNRQLWSSILGVRPDAVDDMRMTQAEMDFYYGTLEPTIAHFREMGYAMPTSSDLEKTMGSIDVALAAQGITPVSVTAPTF